ncbi:MAG: hypothetical protein DME18_07795 [Verrucomicrobia bacterium]|nr:MAG: hypothetical protein DME18_07795 [Verrucomicrobiota bacterium]
MNGWMLARASQYNSGGRQSRPAKQAHIKMRPEDFEKQLQRQPLRKIPAEWRGEILDAARRAHQPQPSAFNPQPASGWRELLWPCPQAWAGLAAVWVLILALNSVTREPARAAQSPNTPRAPEVLIALKEHRRWLAELTGPSAPVEAPKPFVPRPRSELSHRTVAV